MSTAEPTGSATRPGSGGVHDADDAGTSDGATVDPGADLTPVGLPVDRWIDSHCHVDDARIPDGTAAAIAAAHDAGVRAMITVGCDRASSLSSIAVADEHPGVFATVGLHPHEAVHGVDTIADLLTPDAVAAHGIVAVGEAGLDYYYDNSPRDAQRTAFAAQIQLANQLDLPLVIHSRDAWDDTFDVLDAEGVPDRTVFHCFTGDATQARRCLDRSAHVSFSGIVTFKSAEDVREAAAITPLDRLLVETDSPYLAPIPHRGKRNRPAWVVEVGRFLAQFREIDPTDLAVRTSATTQRLFGLTLDA